MPQADRVRARVVIAGRVQGVFFRARCADRARDLGLAGFVRNRPDGDVEAEFEGPSEAVEAIVAWCRVGPAYARVDDVQVQTLPPGGSRGFLVTG